MSIHPSDMKRQRPGCVTAYALLSFLGSALYIIGGLALAYMGFTDTAFTGVGLLFAVCLGVFALLPLAVGIGLWRLRLWGWYLVVITQSIGLAGTLLNICSLLIAGPSQGDFAVFPIIGVIIGVAINGGILYWFVKNKYLFEGAPKMVMGPDGQMIAKPAGNNIALTVVLSVIGGMLFLVVVSIVIIAILALLGPSIGTTFSTIRDTLGTPMP